MSGRRALGAILVAAAAGGCAPEGDDVPPQIVVSAASDLRYAFHEIGEAFERETGVRVTFNFGSTGQLAQQIERGAPVDVFAAANEAFLDELVESGHVLADTRALYARGFLVVWTRDELRPPLEELADLARPGVRRIAIANPEHAPYGIAAREALQAAGLWEALEARLVLGENVNQALQFVQTGNVDAAIVALSLALAPGTGSGRYVEVPEGLHRPLYQALGVVSATRHEREARAFAAFVNGPSGRPVMERYGFELPEGARR